MITAAAASELGAGTGEGGLCTTTLSSELEAVSTVEWVSKSSELIESAATIVSSEASGRFSELSLLTDVVTVCDASVAAIGEFVSVVEVN